MDRRHFIGLVGLGSVAGVGALVTSKLSNARKWGDKDPRVHKILSHAAGKFEPVVEIALKAVAANVSLQPGPPTQVWRYEGKVLRGDPASLQTMDNTYLGPIIRVHRGQKLRVHFTNELPEPTVVHWHGMHVPAVMDGHPRNAIRPGQTYVYEFEIKNRAGTYWYHAHPADRTGPQVYFGLAGLLLVSDDEEEKASLPTDEFDVPLVLQDRTFDGNNQLVYLPGGMMDRMRGFLGDTILVNGRHDYELPVAATAYRLRLLNASNSRIYKLAWNDDSPLIIIGTDGGLLERPVQRKYVTLAPAERVELWADFSHLPVGAKRKLQSLEFSLPAAGMMQNGAATPNGAPLPVLTIRVTKRGKKMPIFPSHLSNITGLRQIDSINHDAPRTFHMTMGHMKWAINNRAFELEGVADDEIVRLDTQETWLLANDRAAGGGMGMMGGMGGMGGMSMPHPIHIHGLQFQVVERQVSADLRAYWETLGLGYVDEGWKDTVLVMPGEQVKLLLRFEDYTGLFLYHCHNLEHEDAGMMRNYLIRK